MKLTDHSLSIALSIILLASVIAQDVSRPTFPDVFETEIQGVFLDSLSEVDGSLFYDRNHNRASLFYTYENEVTRTIYNFDDNQLLFIQGNECSVSEISSEEGASFFPFTTSGDGDKKVLATPEQILYFSQSKFVNQELSTFPSYIYTAEMDFPQYRRTKCEVIHIFSRPEVETPDCDGHSCRPTLTSISIKCPPNPQQEDDPGVRHIYNFFRFRGGIVDPELAFQPPAGIHCLLTSRKQFPNFPPYYSFNYDLVDEEMTSGGEAGVYSLHKKVWYDAELKLVRMDDYEENGLLISSRVFDFYGKTAYTIVATIPQCDVGPLTEDVSLDQMTRLPKLFFATDITQTDAIYVGKREVHGLHYDAWSAALTDPETDAKYVQEFYFIKNLQQEMVSTQSRLTLSHVDIYIYERNNGALELSKMTHLNVNNFRSRPKEWEGFDVSTCFTDEQRKWFRLKVSGPPVLKSSFSYEEIRERLHKKLYIATNVSLIRISELEGKFDGVNVNEFTGWILDKPHVLDSSVPNTEPDMNEAYTILEKAANEGKLDLKFKRKGADIWYHITGLESTAEKSTADKDCFSKGALSLIGVLMLVVGATFGVASHYFYWKRMRPTSVDRIQLTAADLKE